MNNYILNQNNKDGVWDVILGEFSLMNDRILVEVIRVEVLGAEAASSGRWDPLSEATEGAGSGIEARVAVSGALREDAVARALWTRELHWGS